MMGLWNGRSGGSARVVPGTSKGGGVCDDSTYLRQRPPQLSLTLLQLQSFGAVGVLQAQHGLLALPQLRVQLLQLAPEGQHLTGPLRHLRLTLPQLLLEQRDFSCLLTHLPNKARGSGPNPGGDTVHTYSPK